MINANLTSNGYFAAPGGLPFRLYPGQDTAQAFIPAGIVTVTATVVPDYIANVHLAIYYPPTTSNGSDGALVSQVDASAVTASGTTLTLTVPSSTSATYVVRLWYDTALSGKADSIARDTAVTDTTKQALIPYGVSVTNFQVT